MKNINVILDEVTIVNFPFLLKLIRRYWVSIFICVFLIFSWQLHSFYSQNDIYTTSIKFSPNVDDEGGATTGIMAVLGEKVSSGLSVLEILDLNSSKEFYQIVAEKIVSSPNYGALDFSGLKSSHRDLLSEVVGSCNGDKECAAEKIALLVPSFFSIGLANQKWLKYVVDVKSLDPFTSRAIVFAVRDALLEYRVKKIKSLLKEQEDVTNDIILKKRKELATKEYNSLKEELSSLQKKISDTDLKMSNYSRLYEDYKIRISQAEIRTEGNSKTTLGFAPNQADNLRKSSQIREKMSMLQKDLLSLESSPFNSSQTTEIILQIKKEISDAKMELKKLGVSEVNEKTVKSFIEKVNTEATIGTYNVKLLKSEMKKIEQSKNKLDLLRKELVDKKIDIKEKITTLTPSSEYLKVLEGKAMQLKLIVSTVVPDISFDKYPTDVSLYKAISLNKVIIFSFVLSIILTLIIVIFRYIFDKRIYDEVELSKNFKNIKIIGKTPDFL